MVVVVAAAALVSTGKADECVKPVLSNNLMLTDEAILKNDYPDGSEVTLECALGYTVDHGSDTITCIGGSWSDPELICKKKDCGPPKSSPNLTYEIKNGTLFRALVKPVCDTGYYFQGSSYRQCLAFGWSGKAECILITCKKPTEISNGRISTRLDREFPKIADTIEYTCDPNYKLIGNKSILCQNDGEYSSDPPRCEPIVCQAPYVQFGVQIKGESRYTHKSEAVFQCQSGYRMEGSDRIICEEHGWSTLPRCIKEHYQETTKFTATTTSPSTTFPDLVEKMPGPPPNSTDSADIVYTAAVIGSILSVLVAVLAIVFIVRHQIKRKGSYNTGEALKTKEELLLKTSPNLTPI